MPLISWVSVRAAIPVCGVIENIVQKLSRQLVEAYLWFQDFLIHPPGCHYICLSEYMKTKSANHVDRLFRAFSDRTRLRILNLLLRGELCVCDIVGVLGVPQPTASRHLAYLRRAGLVLARKEGLWHYYQLAPARSAFHRKLIECLGCCFQDVPQLAKDAKNLGRCTKCCK